MEMSLILIPVNCFNDYDTDSKSQDIIIDTNGYIHPAYIELNKAAYPTTSYNSGWLYFYSVQKKIVYQGKVPANFNIIKLI